MPPEPISTMRITIMETIPILLFVLFQGANASLKTNAFSKISKREKAMLNKNNSIQKQPLPQELRPRIYTDKPLLRGEFHRMGALLYPILLGLPLFLRATPSNRKATLLFSLAVEGIMVASAALHTFPWRCPTKHSVAVRVDYAMIFVGIALFYSSIGQLLLGTNALFTNIIEPVVWACAVVGVLAKWLFPEAPPYINATIFLMQGWAIGPLIPELFRTVSLAEAAALLAGGIFITLGAIAYSVRWPEGHMGINPDVFGPHEMFHIGTLCMFVSFWWSMWIRVAR